MTLRIALYEPDIPQNTGTVLRLCACLGIDAHIIEPAGFPASDRAFRRAGMDYLDAVALVRHVHGGNSKLGGGRNAIGLCCSRPPRRCPISITALRPDDILLFGREIRGRAARGPRRGRCPAGHPDAAGPAFAQCRTRRRHGRRRSAAADRGDAAIEFRAALSLHHAGMAALDRISLQCRDSRPWDRARRTPPACAPASCRAARSTQT